MPQARTRSYSKQLVDRISSEKSPSRAKSLRVQSHAVSKETNFVNSENGLGSHNNVNVKSHSGIKSKGKVSQAPNSVKPKAKKISSARLKSQIAPATRLRVQNHIASNRSSESLSTSRHDGTMSVLARAAARKRRLDGDDEAESKPKLKRGSGVAKKKASKRTSTAKTVVFHDDDDTGVLCVGDEVVGHEEEVVEEPEEDHGIMAVKRDEVALPARFGGVRYQQNAALHDAAVVSGDHMNADTPGDDLAEGKRDDGGEEDIDENLFFGIPDPNSPDPATCTYCKSKFPKEDVHDHMLTCTERYVQCRDCGKVLSNLQTLERHHKRFHLKIREVPCTLCDKMFIDEAAARKHVKTVHFKVKSFHCPHCDKSFSQRNKLTYHVRTHSGEKPYSCAECGRSFSLLWNLKTHLRTHTGEKPYCCDTCGRRFTQKQNMTSHLTTHRKPKADKSFRNHFGNKNLESLNRSSSPPLGESLVSFGESACNYEASLKQIGAPQIDGGHYIIGDAHNIEVCTVNEQDEGNLGLEHGLGLLSSVARKGGDHIGDAMQVDGIVTVPDGQMALNQNMDRVVEVLIKTSGEIDTAGNHVTTFHLSGNASQSGVDGSDSTADLTSIDGQEVTVDGATAATLANILQNPDVLAAISAAATSNKFIVIGPVSMFDQSGTRSQLSSVVHGRLTDRSGVAYLGDTLVHLPSETNPQDHTLGDPSRIVKDSISASVSLTAMERYFQGSAPLPCPSSGGDHLPPAVLSAIQADGKRGPTSIVQSVQASRSRVANFSISMPPMSQMPLTISPKGASNLGSVASTQLSKMRYVPVSTSLGQSEVSSSVGADMRATVDSISSLSQAEVVNELVESMTHCEEMSEIQDRTSSGTFAAAESPTGNPGSFESNSEVGSSGDEPVLILGTDENGRPQIIVRMPDGSETIMSDPALAESFIRVPSITNTGVLDGDGALDQQQHEQQHEQQHLDFESHIENTLEIPVPNRSISQSLFCQGQNGEHVHHDAVGTSPDSVVVRLAGENTHSTSCPALRLVQSSLDADGGLDVSVDGNIDRSSQVVSLVEEPALSSGLRSEKEQTFGALGNSSSHGLSSGASVTHIDSRQSVYLVRHLDLGDEVNHGNEAEQGKEAVSVVNFHLHMVDGEQALQLGDVRQSSCYAPALDEFEIRMTSDGVSSSVAQC